MRYRGLGLIWVCCLAWVLLLGCGGPGPRYPYGNEPDPRKMEFVIGINDDLRIEVWRNPELTTTIRVRHDGTITMPLVGDIKADGLTPTQLKKKIADKLALYVKEAIVTVAVTAVQSYRITLSGEVRSPGIFAPQQYVTVAEAVALAGGVTQFATPEKAVLIRLDKSRGVRRIPINIAEIQAGEHLEQNIVMMKGDTLIIP